MSIPFRLAVSNVFRSPLRCVLTLVATTLAFVLYATLIGVVSGIDGAFERLGDTRLRVLNRTGPLETLPIAYGTRLSSVAEHVAIGMLWACAIGLIGASLPGYRIAKSPIARGLQVA